MRFVCVVLAMVMGSTASAAVMGADERATFVQYARLKGIKGSDVERRYSATGIISCLTNDGKVREGTAQVTGSRSVITTAGHMFFDKTCRRVSFKSCNFRSLANENSRSYPANLSSLAVGGCAQRDVRMDWAVMELVKPVSESVEPYQIPAHDFMPSPSTGITQVTGFSLNFVTGGNRVKHITDCQVREVEYFPTYPLQTDCDAGFGTSGSAQLMETPYGPILIAIHVASSADQEGLAYDRHRNFSVSTPLRGAFLEALQAKVRSGVQRASLPNGKSF